MSERPDPAAVPSHEHVHEHEHGAARRPFWTPGTLVLVATMVVGFGFGLVRFVAGLGPVTNLDDGHPWGIWIAIDVASGVALAAGGFTVAALVNIFGRRRYEALERPALLTAWLGYTFVGAGLLFDLGRYYNIWHPAIYWQGNSVLFEVGMCVMFYLTVLTVEFAPTLLAGLSQSIERQRWWTRPLRRLAPAVLTLRLLVRRVLPIFIIAGVVLSFMHQSSLGSLMLIAPSKVSPLWWTPMLPVLFLLSAIMVGFPVVIFESIAAARAFGRRPEMELLAPLSRLILLPIAVYAAVKLGDVFYRNDLSVFTRDAGQTMAWLVEVGVGLLIPFILLTQRSVRESPRWLTLAVSLIIGGVVLNRINVFLVAYEPRGAGGYFPAVGELAITAALVATIIFLYRFFANFFPVLSGPEGDAQEAQIRADAHEGKVGIGGWIARGAAVLLVLGFIDIYSCVHDQATKKPPHREVARRRPPASSPASGPASAPASTPATVAQRPGLLWLSTPTVVGARRRKGDTYQPVRFAHRAHAVFTDGDCQRCHHRVQRRRGGKVDRHDRVGERAPRHALAAAQITRCSACHQRANEPDAPTRPGLRGAFHRRCVGCHERRGDKAPTTCQGACHRRHPADHSKLVKLPSGPITVERVTAECLRCHRQQRRDLASTLHGRQRGPRRPTCLSCHNGTGTYPAAKGRAAIVAMARSVRRPQRRTCGGCHLRGDRADLAITLAKPSASVDVHMGRVGLDCQDCHRTRRHRLQREAPSPSGDHRVRCESCHGERPHRFDTLLGKHLDAHTASLACQSCHIPSVVTRGKAVKLTHRWLDRRKAGPQGRRAQREARIAPFAPRRRQGADLAPVSHQVVAKGRALRCADCHAKATVACKRCHPAADHDTYHPTETGPCRQCHEGAAATGKWMRFQALGYKGDPAQVGGRFRTMPLPPMSRAAVPKGAPTTKPALPYQYTGVHE